MRLIDADALPTDAFLNTKMVLQTDIDNAPTIDAEPIVRCKDCEYWRNDDCKNDNHGYCPISENDFCSRGVRKEKR